MGIQEVQTLLDSVTITSSSEIIIAFKISQGVVPNANDPICLLRPKIDQAAANFNPSSDLTTEENVLLDEVIRIYAEVTDKRKSGITDITAFLSAEE